MFAKAPRAIGPDETSVEVETALAEIGAALLLDVVNLMAAGEADETPQDDAQATYAPKITREESAVDWSLPAARIHNLVRGLWPFPGAFFEAGPEGKRERIKVLRSELAPGRGKPGEVVDEHLTVACGEGAVRLVELQRAGKKPMAAGELLRGFPIPRGTRL